VHHHKWISAPKIISGFSVDNKMVHEN